MDWNAWAMAGEREHDACGIFSRIEKSGVVSHKPVQDGLQALRAMRHRAGYVGGEGDGCGLLLDIPRLLWSHWLRDAGHPADLAHDERFFVAHLFVPRRRLDAAMVRLRESFTAHGMQVLVVRADVAQRSALGLSASREDLAFVQCGALGKHADAGELFRLMSALENVEEIHVASMNHHTVVYKVVGDADTLWGYYPDLRDALCTSGYVLAHTRYSTNTATSTRRVQPFATLGHNGEINTIARFYTESAMIGISLDPSSSDSQMVDRALNCMTAERGWSLFETAELLFPPIIHEIKQMDTSLSDMYMFLRSLWGPFAQGPAGVMMRMGDEAVYSVDALGLRPLWLVETADAYCFSSEQGIVPADQWRAEPKPLAPGEKIGVQWTENDGVQLVSYPDLQRHVLSTMADRYTFTGEGRSIHFAGPYHQPDAVSHPHRDTKPLGIRQAAFGWREDDVKLLEFEIQTSAEPIRSLGYDGPLAALDPNLHLLSDFLQETVAVVTNPAIDREREIEHFSIRTVLGKRPSLAGLYQDSLRVEIQSPLLMEELPAYTEVTRDEIQMLAHRHGTLCYEDALAALRTNPYGTTEILIHREEGESIEKALERLRLEAVEAVQAGANAIVLDDRLQFTRGSHLDPFLAVAVVHRALQRPASSQGGEHLRRRTSLVLRSGGLRNLHDIAVAIGLGADAVNPYLMWETAASKGNVQAVGNLYAALCKGIEKVLSTLGIHEVRGYERLFGAIGLQDALAASLGIKNFCGQRAGFGLADMEREALRRQELYAAQTEREVGRNRGFQLYPRLWKAAGQVANGTGSYGDYLERLEALERENPISLRHVLGLQPVADATDDLDVDDASIDTSIDGHQFPFVISSMSFGSQGETAYRSYAEAAYRLNIVGLNGEGGEIKDMLGRNPRNRGRQVASGRFGVNAELCNGVYVLEIKIGQGAKPGEGGHLPGSKVTAQVANARNASTGVDLISPSNNHDIYSIEDLAQVIYELRQINPEARIAVKVPIVPNIGTIAVGIVKAGADIVNLSGFDGGTGAARAHALRHVGLPHEIGIKLAHDALCEAGLRDVAEVWADGGMKSGTDVMKAILLGANRAGFGTMAMVAVGCTSCRACHKDTCHVGIATQIKDEHEAAEKGLPAFVPREFEQSVSQLTRLFGEIGRHVARLTRQLGATRTQDLVGRSDLLVQFGLLDRLDLEWLTQVQQQHIGRGTHIVWRQMLADEAGMAAETTTLAMAAGAGAAAVSVSSGTNSSTSVAGHSLRLVGSAGAGHAAASSDTLQSVARTLGTRQSGERVRNRQPGDARWQYEHPGVAGNGFAAYHGVGMQSVAHGGAQDGVGKGAYGGRIVVLKHRGPDGVWRGGSVGKGLAYGAQRGLFIIQGSADARAGIRLSGADIVIAGTPEEPLQDGLGWIAARSNMKGFAFEYMTAGRAVVLGDPGPWICSGMTGGTVYLRHDPDFGLTEAALRRRIAKGAKVGLRILDAQGVDDVVELLTSYAKELKRSGQIEAAQALQPLLRQPADHFLMVRPGEDITDQSIATE